MSNHFNPEFSDRTERNSPDIKNNVPESHRLIADGQEQLTERAHTITLEKPGYLGDPELLLALQEDGYILPVVDEGDSDTYTYDALGLTSLAGFLNSTRVDSRGAEKRTVIVEKISRIIDELSVKKVVIGSNRDVTYKILALDESTRPVFLPTGVSFSTADTESYAEAQNRIAKLQIASSVLSVMGSGDRTPFDGLLRP